jgi:hypothetical protein
MRPTFQARLTNLAQTVRRNNEGLYAVPLEGDVIDIEVGEANQSLYKALEVMARHEVEVDPAKIEASQVPAARMYSETKREVERLMAEGIMRVIDDRRQDPEYLGSLDPEELQALEATESVLRARVSPVDTSDSDQSSS